MARINNGTIYSVQAIVNRLPKKLSKRALYQPVNYFVKGFDAGLDNDALDAIEEVFDLEYKEMKVRIKAIRAKKNIKIN